MLTRFLSFIEFYFMALMSFLTGLYHETGLAAAVEYGERKLDAFGSWLEPRIEKLALWIVDNKFKVLIFDAAICYNLWFFDLGSWALWAHVLVAQNFAFTFVSRARNSGSLLRHLKASIASNGVWFASQTIIFSKLMEYLYGKHGLGFAIYTGSFYTFFTIIGAVIAHAHSLRTEKGKSAVGASSKYAQITKDEWAEVKAMVTALSFTNRHSLNELVVTGLSTGSDTATSSQETERRTEVMLPKLGVQ